MADESASPTHPDGIEMPRPTAAPLILSVGIVLLGAGVALSWAISIIGLLVFLTGLSLWIEDLLPGQGHFHEERVPRKPEAITPRVGAVEQMREGMPGYRMRLPLEVHPISAGVKGGLVGGVLMPIPALLWGILSGHGIWYPVNLLAGMASIGAESLTVAELEQFRPGLLVLGLVIHVVMSAVIGLIYGVLMPTLPYVHRSVAWGGLLMPMLWSALSFLLMQRLNPVLAEGVRWPWFILSQFIFGVVAGLVVMANIGRRSPVAAGLLGGLAGALVMPIPALIWGAASGHGIWYPLNLLAAMVDPGVSHLPLAEFRRFRAEWLSQALTLHAALSASFGVLYAFVLPKLPPIPAPLSWGGALLPLLWSAMSYALMGVVNPLLQERVDWPWFIVSQFIFGIAAAIVVVNSEMIPVPPVGPGPAPESPQEATP